MADEADRGYIQEEALRQSAIANRKPEAPAFNGKCLFCGEKTEAPKRWCDAECRDLWDKYGRSDDYDETD